MFLPAVCNCTKLVYWYLVLLSWQIHACVTGWWLCFRPTLEGMSQILFFTVCTSDLQDCSVTRMGPCACLQVEKESCDSRNGVRKNNSWIIKGASTGAPRLVSTSVPFWASTESKCHWLLSNLEVEKRNSILSYSQMELPSPAVFDCGRSMGVLVLVWMVPALSSLAESFIAELSN